MVVMAIVLLFAVVLRPRTADVPLSRRRPDGFKKGSALSRFADTTVSTVDGMMGHSGGWFNRNVLYNAGVRLAPADFTVLVLAGSLVLGLAGGLLVHAFAGILLAVLAPLLAKLALGILADKRRAKFDAQLLDTLLMLTGGLRAGHSILSSFDAAAQESEAPMSEELSRIVNESRLGRDFTAAIMESAGRMRSEDFGWIGQAVDINREVGGDLAEVLDQVGETIRERSQIRGQIRALSAEGKISAYVLVALPICVALAISVINPGYVGTLTQSLLGWVMVGFGGLLLVAGSVWMSRVIKIKF
ncbi:type II secretion system F family protein [Arthrobacter sp. I2-34]|uniref:Type II secretion system F family protein n=1 Tax=Arthrobacter hankyongi TaxID=2904801 RepID=A0ABS9L4K6_9MICC|nr:type II secretion system F family protein [Arthrobacter hankyongi]MCG2621610.1 type II secretion system F family protein [Arthrobacter hankyongi]